MNLFAFTIGNISAAENSISMTVSHRRFGDLLEEGIKRVHINRKKPIGYILDEFGYELRPDDSSKGRYSLGHWYYKKRIPASMQDVATLARLIVTNSDVERDWLKAFLESAGYENAEAFCNQFFIPYPGETRVNEPAQPDQGIAVPAVLEETFDPIHQSVKSSRSWTLYLIGVVMLLAVTASIFKDRWSRQAPGVDADPTRAIGLQSTLSPMPTEEQPTFTSTPAGSTSLPSFSPTPDFATFDWQCPTGSASPSFEYSSSQSFAEYLNNGGSFIALKSGFDALVQKKETIKDGRISTSDLNNDGVPEIIVSAILDKGSVWQILGCNTGHYQALADVQDSSFRYLRFAVDLNGNEFPEIIGYRRTQAESSEVYEFFVQEWNGHQIVDRVDNTRFEQVGKRLPSDITDWRRAVANATVTTRDTNGDSLFEVIFTGGLITPVPTCDTRFERQFTEVWTWRGQSMQLMERVYIPPIYRFQRSADGDLAFALRQYDRALEAYQDVLFDSKLYRRDQYLPHLEYCSQMEPSTDLASAKDEPEILEAYARWRILLINALTVSQESAQVVYQTLQEKFPEGKPGHSYAVIASEFWNRYQATQNINDACAAANSAANDQVLYPSHKPVNICFAP